MENKKNKGILFKNDYKTKDTHPEYKGSALIDCPHCQAEIKKDISSWVNKQEGKKPYLSIVFNEPYVKPEKTEDKENKEDKPDDLPF